MSDTADAGEPARRSARSRWWPWSPRLSRRRRRILAGLLLTPVLILVLALGALVAHGSGAVDRSLRSSGQDAYWLGHSWVDGRQTQADVDALARRLTDAGIRDLYVHAGPYADDGTLDPTLRPRARWLVQALHTARPGVRVQAWLGNVLSDDRMDLSSEQTRANVLTGVDDVLADGFDGVHYDFEPARNGNQAFLDLLEATHTKTLAQQAVFSVATPKVEPLAGMNRLAGILPMHTLWSKDYLRQVAEHVDQIAIMAYDTALPSEKAYRGYIRRQTEVALETVPTDVALLIGAPAYNDNNLYRFDSAETVSAAIAGVQLALSGRPREGSFGLALYVDFETTAQDWDSYLRDWA